MAATKEIFMQQGFIDAEWNLLNWNRRQFLSDSSTDRVRRHREALKQDETLHETERNVTVTAPDTDTDTEQKKKPSRAKTARATKDPTKTDLAKARHAEFKSIIAEYWDSKNKGVQMPWDGREGKHLEMFLRAAPHITAEQFRGFLRNRFKSEVNHGERASQWIAWVTNYAQGPMDRFGKTIGAVNGRATEGMKFANE
jgi:hypothetical protein